MRGSGERRDCLRDQMLLRLPNLIESLARARPLGHVEESVVGEVLRRPRGPKVLDRLAVVIDLEGGSVEGEEARAQSRSQSRGSDGAEGGFDAP